MCLMLLWYKNGGNSADHNSGKVLYRNPVIFILPYQNFLATGDTLNIIMAYEVVVTSKTKGIHYIVTPCDPNCNTDIILVLYKEIALVKG